MQKEMAVCYLKEKATLKSSYKYNLKTLKNLKALFQVLSPLISEYPGN